jgi:hypothetical protein
MEAMQTSVNSGSFRKHLVHLIGVAVAATIWLASSPAFAQACPAGDAVDVEPAGDNIAGNLVSGSSAVFTAGNIAVSCAASHTSGTIPTAGNPGDPVNGVLAPPTFTNCSTNVGLAATTTTNSTNGNWGLDISCGSTATLHVPRAGAVSRVATCTITVAPTAAVDVPATWTNGSPGTLTISATLPISHSGLFCPNVNSATFTATYNITDTTNPAANVTATEVTL